MSKPVRSAPEPEGLRETTLSPSAPARRGGATHEQLAVQWVAVLEDDEDQGALLCHWIRPMLGGRELHWFRRANELVEFAENARASAPGLLLCDYELEDGDALSVLRRLSPSRHQPESARVAVVVVSAHIDPARREAALRAGAADWLTKPLSRDAVQRVVRMMDGTWGQAHAAASPCS